MPRRIDRLVAVRALQRAPLSLGCFDTWQLGRPLASTEGVGGYEWLSVGIVGGPNVVEDLLTFVWRAASIVLVL